MDGRAVFAFGGFLVGATVVAVASAVTLSSSVALADAPGTAVGVDVVRVTPRTPSATPAARVATQTLAPEIPPTVPTAEVVPAPAPLDVAAHAPAAGAGGSVPSSASAVVDQHASKREVEEEALRTGSWDRLRGWAAANGWSADRVDQWISVLEARISRQQPTEKQSTERTKTLANASDETGESSGSKRAQSPQPPRGD